MYDVVALGELLIDFTTQSVDPDGYPAMAAHPGGAPANFLAAIAKFGGKAARSGRRFKSCGRCRRISKF